MVDSLNGGHVS